MSTNDRTALIAGAEAVADAMGEVARTFYHQDSATLGAQLKADKTFVTEADRQTEDAARQVLARLFPDDGILGEEREGHEGPSGRVWVIDPIDGTKAFMDGLPFFTNLLGVVEDGQLVLGIINQPIAHERWIGGPSIPTRYRYRDAHGQPIEIPARCLPATTLDALAWRSTTVEHLSPDEIPRFNRLAARVKSRHAGDAYPYGALARGRTLTAVVDADLAPWDIAGPAAVVLGAGGVVTDMAGLPLDYLKSGKTSVLAACTPAMHQAIRRVFEGDQM